MINIVYTKFKFLIYPHINYTREILCLACYDLCKALSFPLLKQPHNDLKKIIAPLEAELGGKITVDKAGHFYLNMPKQGKVEISLIAEGYRKIAIVVLDEVLAQDDREQDFYYKSGQ